MKNKQQVIVNVVVAVLFIIVLVWEKHRGGDAIETGCRIILIACLVFLMRSKVRRP